MLKLHAMKTYWTAAAVVCAATILAATPSSSGPKAPAPLSHESRPGVVQCANLIYGRDKSSVCFSDEFLAQVQKDTHVRTNRRFCSVKLEDRELMGYPFAVMTGEGAFKLTDSQRANLRTYLTRGGFLIASAGCSSSPWNASFLAEIRQTFPDNPLKALPLTHPVFHTVYDIAKLKTKSPTKVIIEALEIDGKIVLIYSREGLNDTANAGPGCCCCGGNEIYNARQINANVLAYALTH